MGIFRGPNIVREGLILGLDSASTRSYPGIGTTWYDLSIKGNNATLQNGATFNINGYISLEGNDDRVSIPNTTGDFNLGLGDFTVTLWINQGYDTTYPHLFAFDDQSNFCLKAVRGGTVDAFQIYVYQGSSIMFPNSYLTPATWQMITLTRVGNNHKLFINGVLTDTVLATAKNITCSNMYFGWGWGTEYTPQSRGPIYIYNVPLSDQQILEHYESQHARF